MLRSDPPIDLTDCKHGSEYQEFCHNERNLLTQRYYKQEKINESRDYHFKQNILLSVEEDPLDDNLLRGDDDFEQSLYTSKSSIIHTTTNTMFGDSDEDL